MFLYIEMYCILLRSLSPLNIPTTYHNGRVGIYTKASFVALLCDQQSTGLSCNDGQKGSVVSVEVFFATIVNGLLSGIWLRREGKMILNSCTSISRASLFLTTLLNPKCIYLLSFIILPRLMIA